MSVEHADRVRSVRVLDNVQFLGDVGNAGGDIGGEQLFYTHMRSECGSCNFITSASVHMRQWRLLLWQWAARRVLLPVIAPHNT